MRPFAGRKSEANRAVVGVIGAMRLTPIAPCDLPVCGESCP
jgi:hypothetical protein